MNETMRPQFYSGCWEIEKTVPGEIFISQGDYPLKGFHYLLQAMQEILQNCPEAHIKVAGISVLGVNGIKSRIKIPAYGKYLRLSLIHIYPKRRTSDPVVFCKDVLPHHE